MVHFPLSLSTIPEGKHWLLGPIYCWHMHIHMHTVLILATPHKWTHVKHRTISFFKKIKTYRSSQRTRRVYLLFQKQDAFSPIIKRLSADIPRYSVPRYPSESKFNPASFMLRSNQLPSGKRLHSYGKSPSSKNQDK